MYQISQYTYNRAKEIGVQVKPSIKKNKKIDVYKNGELIGSIGGYGYKDYPTYVTEKGIEYANKRRELYRLRHQKDRQVLWSNGWLASKLLW